jgi:hypothetical protein
LLRQKRTDTGHKLARPCRDTGQTSDNLCWGWLGRKSENPAYRQSAQRGIRLFKLRKHQDKAALFKHITLFLRTCSIPDCNTRENHCPAPCIDTVQCYSLLLTPAASGVPECWPFARVSTGASCCCALCRCPPTHPPNHHHPCLYTRITLSI